MYTYLISNGESYSDYRVLGVIVSEKPVNWRQAYQQMAAYLNANKDKLKRRWYLEDDQFAAMLAAAGITFIEYKEVIIDPRFDSDRFDSGDDAPWSVVG